MQSNRAIPWQKGFLIHCAKQTITKYGFLQSILSKNQLDHEIQKLTKSKVMIRISLHSLRRLIQVDTLCRCIRLFLHSTAEMESNDMHSLSSIHDVCRDLIDKLNLSKNLQFYEHLQELSSFFFFLAHLSTTCSREAFRVVMCPSCVVNDFFDVCFPLPNMRFNSDCRSWALSLVLWLANSVHWNPFPYKHFFLLPHYFLPFDEYYVLIFFWKYFHFFGGKEMRNVW